MKRFLAAILRWPLVWTVDYDGEVRLRRVYTDKFGGMRVRGILSFCFYLQPNGTVLGYEYSYVTSWKPANKKAQSLFTATERTPR